MPAPVPNTANLLQRMADAVELVHQRLLRATTALTDAGIDHAVVGGNAVAAWVKTVDPDGIRTTLDVDILLRRADFEKAKDALAKAGFFYRHASGLDMFLDGPTGSPRSGVHILFANELVRPDQPLPNPDVRESVEMSHIRFVSLEALVRNKLSAFRDKDRTHIRDFLAVGLIDESWVKRLPPVLAARLRQILDTPDG